MAGLLSVCLAVAGLTATSAIAHGTTPLKRVLFYGPTSGGLAAATPGIDATVWDETTWASKTTADFAQFDAIAFGDEPACGVSEAMWSTAIANRDVWSAAITGNVTINGTDPDYHGKPNFVQPSVDFAASGHGTGLYVSLSCVYEYSSPATSPTVVDLLGGLGTFKVRSVDNCPVSAHIVATHPSLAAVDDAYMSGWGCSAHEGFTEWPANFSPLVIITDASTAPYTASDGTQGLVYVLASGARTSGLSMTPRNGTGVPGTTHAVVARQADASDNPQPGVKITFTVADGPNKGIAGTCAPVSCVTNSAGQVMWTYKSGSSSGDDTIVAFQDTNGNGVPDGGEPQTTALMNWDLANGKYIAIGDSFSAGEGNPPFFTSSPAPAPSYNSASDGCHRSDHAYPKVAWRADLSIPTNMQFWACSGATTDALYNTFDGEPRQLNHIDKSTTLVTLTMGGNDANFPAVIQDCTIAPCAEKWGKRVSDKITQLGNLDPKATGTFLSDYKNIKAQAAPGARVLVLGYPRFFPTGGGGFGLGCNLVLKGDQRWINQQVHAMDVAIQNAANAAGIEYVDTENAFDGYELCNGKGNPSAMNGLMTTIVYNFHPDSLGQQFLANAVLTELSQPDASLLFDMLPGLTLGSGETVPGGTGLVSFTSTWPGSTVTMTLVSPSGKIIDASTTDPKIIHTSYPTSETYSVVDPEPGTWTVKLFGTDVAFAGEPTSLRVTEAPPEVLNGVTTTTVTSNVNPSAFGQSVSLTATVSGSGTPTGSVQFFDGATSLGSGALVGGSYALTTSSLIVGTHPITAVYSGDSSFVTSTSDVLSQVINRASTLTTLTTSPASAGRFGHPVTFTATVNVPSPASGSPTGTIGFTVDGRPVGLGVVNGSEQASLTTAALTPGSHLIGSTYSGDGSFQASQATTSYLVTCGVTITGIHVGSLIVTADSTCLADANVTGAIVVQRGASLAVIGSTIRGSISAATSPGAITVCASSVIGSLNITAAQGLVIVGDAGDANCGPNNIGGALQLRNNAHGVMAIGNTVGGAIITSGNSGPGPYPGDTTTIGGNAAPGAPPLHGAV